MPRGLLEREIRVESISSIEGMYAAQLAVLSPNTVRQHHVALKSALAMAVRNGLLASSLLESMRRPRSGRPAERRALESSEIRLLLDEASGTHLDAPIRLAVATGLCEGELLALSWDDLTRLARRFR